MKRLIIISLVSSCFFGNLYLTPQSLQAQSTETKKTKAPKSKYDIAMKAGYEAFNKKDFKTALTNFKLALSLRPKNVYAIKAIQNTEKRLAGK
jgi:Flp pilus assembly protein TadD